MSPLRLLSWTMVLRWSESVATTTTKSPGVIKTDLRKVLDRMQVQYRETKTGFECIHLPSIDISSLAAARDHQAAHNGGATVRGHRKSGSGESGGTATRRIVRKASKISFGKQRREKEKERTNTLSRADTARTTSRSSNFRWQSGSELRTRPRRSVTSPPRSSTPPRPCRPS